jgi:hypothetical protein
MGALPLRIGLVVVLCILLRFNIFPFYLFFVTPSASKGSGVFATSVLVRIRVRKLLYSFQLLQRALPGGDTKGVWCITVAQPRSRTVRATH